MAVKDFAEEVSAAYDRALGTLNQFASGKRLTADWPEALPVIGSLIPEGDRQLPVVQLAAVNNDFGLPPSERLAA